MKNFIYEKNKGDNNSDFLKINSFIRKNNNKLIPELKSNSKRERYYLGGEFYNEYLTRMEFVVLQHILLGKTAVRIANEMNISRRTVEYHTENLKLKMQCRTKGEVIAKAVRFIFLVEEK